MWKLTAVGPDLRSAMCAASQLPGGGPLPLHLHLPVNQTHDDADGDDNDDSDDVKSCLILAVLLNFVNFGIVFREDCEYILGKCLDTSRLKSEGIKDICNRLEKTDTGACISVRQYMSK